MIYSELFASLLTIVTCFKFNVKTDIIDYRTLWSQPEIKTTISSNLPLSSENKAKDIKIENLTVNKTHALTEHRLAVPVINRIDEAYNNGTVVPAQLTSYAMDGGGCDGTRWTEDMLECATIDRRLCGGTVEFYNTGYSNLDGVTFEIHDIGGAVNYRQDQYSPTGGSYVFDLLQSEGLQYLLGDQWNAFISEGRVKGCKAVVHAPNGCTYVFEHLYSQPVITEESVITEEYEEPVEYEIIEEYEEPDYFIGYSE